MALQKLALAVVALLSAAANAEDPRPELELALLRLPQAPAAWSVAVSPDGKTVATGHDGGRPGEIILWDAGTGAMLQTFHGHADGHSNYIFCLAFSPDGKTLASGTGSYERSGEVLLRDAATGVIRHRLVAHKNYVQAIAFSPDGASLATWASGERKVLFWDVKTGKRQRTLELSHGRPVYSAAFSADGKLIAMGDDRNTIKLWDANTGKLRHSCESSDGTPAALAFSPDGTMLASRGTTSSEPVRLWDTQSGKLLRALKSTGSSGRALVFSPDNKSLASGTELDSATIWDTQTGQVKHTLEGRDKRIAALAYHPTGRFLVGAGNDRMGLIWDPATGKLVRTLRSYHTEATGLALSGDGKTLASAHTHDSKSVIRLWDARSGTLERTLLGHELATIAVAFTDRKVLTSWGGSRNRVEWWTWDAATGKRRQALSWDELGVRAFAPAPDGKRAALLAEGAGKKTLVVKILDADGKTLDTWPVEQAHAFDLAWTPDGKNVAVCAAGVHLLDAKTGKQQLVLKPKKDGFRSRDALVKPRFAGGGQALAAAIPLHTRISMTEVGVWDLKGGYTLLGEFHYSAQPLAFSPDSATLLVGHGDHEGTASLWDWKAGKLRRTMAGHRQQTTGGAFTPGGRLMITAGHDATLKWWDAATGQLRATLVLLPSLEEGRVPDEWLAYTPEGFFTGSANATRFMQWREGTQLYPAERHDKALRRPERVAQVLAE